MSFPHVEPPDGDSDSKQRTGSVCLVGAVGSGCDDGFVAG